LKVAKEFLDGDEKGKILLDLEPDGSPTPEDKELPAQLAEFAKLASEMPSVYAPESVAELKSAEEKTLHASQSKRTPSGRPFSYARGLVANFTKPVLVAVVGLLKKAGAVAETGGEYVFKGVATGTGILLGQELVAGPILTLIEAAAEITGSKFFQVVVGLIRAALGL